MMGKQNCFKRSTAPAVSDFTWGTGCVAGGSGKSGHLCGKTIDTPVRETRACVASAPCSGCVVCGPRAMAAV